MKKSSVVLVSTMWGCVCGHTWFSRVKNPNRCPGCGRRKKTKTRRRAYKL